jgi:hypothetical protein
MSYLDQARSRAKRRKSLWNILLIPAVALPLFTLWWSTSAALSKLYRVIHVGQQFRGLPDSVGGIIMAVAPFFAWLGPSMIIGNLLVATIPPARRVLDAEAAPFAGTDRRSANRDLLRISLLMTPAGLLLAIVGALIK